MPAIGQPFYLILVILVAIQRLVELKISRSHEVWLLSQGAYEVGKDHYKYMVIVHTLWLVTCLALPFIGPSSSLIVGLGQWIFLFIFILGQVFRLLAITTLKKRWTTKLILWPCHKPVDKGIYRYFSHPNYLGVVLEIFSLPLIWGAWSWALIFGFLNFLVLFIRLRLEHRAIQEMSGELATP